MRDFREKIRVSTTKENRYVSAKRKLPTGKHKMYVQKSKKTLAYKAALNQAIFQRSFLCI